MAFNRILEFWFQGITDDTVIQKSKPPFNLWFSGGRRFDQAITEGFEETYIQAKSGECRSWEGAPKGALALILLFDQFARNMYRNTPKMFETDEQALKLANRLIKEGSDRELTLIERIFVYLPLTHAENLACQTTCVRKFEELIGESKIKNPRNTPYYEYHLTYVVKYHKIIEDFGRFPHRNAVLNRPSTDKEKIFLMSQ
jgi:uncharacterized protein (DUF924 family)